MKEHEQSFQPESVDEQIDQLPGILSPEDMRLVQDLRRTYHPFAEKNIYSLESV